MWKAEDPMIGNAIREQTEDKKCRGWKLSASRLLSAVLR